MPDLKQDDLAICSTIPLLFPLMNSVQEQQLWLQMEQGACRY